LKKEKSLADVANNCDILMLGGGKSFVSVAQGWQFSCNYFPISGVTPLRGK
jgi:hypothetical protein